MQIKDLAIGTKIKLEGHEVYVMAHNYESSLNGRGRTLVRWAKSIGEAPWSRGNKYYINDYIASYFKGKLSAKTLGWIGTTMHKVNYRYNNVTYTGPSSRQSTDSFFVISAGEYRPRFYNYSYIDGTELSSAAKSVVDSTVGGWMRTLDGSYDSDGDWVWAYTTDGKHDQGGNYSIVPMCTLPETLYVLDDGTITENQPPEVTSDAGATGAELGEKNAPFTVGYTVTDKDGDLMTVTEKLDGAEQAVKAEVATGTALTVEWLSEKVGYQQVLNGAHTLTLTVSDGKTSTDWTATFTKNITGAKVSLTAPLTADDIITVAALTLEGSFPGDMSLTVELTNNGLDDAPVWENCTDIQSGESWVFVHHAFTNKTAARGFAFNYKVTISRGESGVGGSVTMIGGVIG